MFPEFLVLQAAGPTHSLHHLFVEFHGRGKDLGVTAKNVPKVNMNQVTRFGQQEVVQVSVTHPQQVSDHTVTSYMHVTKFVTVNGVSHAEKLVLTTALDVSVHDFRLNSIGRSLLRCTLSEKSLERKIKESDLLA